MKRTLLFALITCAAMPVFANEKDGDHGKWIQYHFKKCDTNGDGYISREEKMAAVEKMFDEADTNKDGKLSMDEVKAAKKKEKMEMKAAMDSNPAKADEAKKPMSH